MKNTAEGSTSLVAEEAPEVVLILRMMFQSYCVLLWNKLNFRRFKKILMIIVIIMTVIIIIIIIILMIILINIILLLAAETRGKLMKT